MKYRHGECLGPARRAVRESLVHDLTFKLSTCSSFFLAPPLGKMLSTQGPCSLSCFVCLRHGHYLVVQALTTDRCKLAAASFVLS